jgi:hypothetical protein
MLVQNRFLNIVLFFTIVPILYCSNPNNNIKVINNNSSENISSSNIQSNIVDYKLKFTQSAIPIKSEDKNRFFDCVEEAPIPYPSPFVVKHQMFNYFSESRVPGIQFGLIALGDWPIVVGMYNQVESTNKKPNVIITMRGDTSGYHKSSAALPFYNYIENKKKEKVMFFLDEYIYVNESEKNIQKDKIMALCHNKPYWIGPIGKEWPALEKGANWKLLDKFFPEDQKYEIFSYSNATWPRMEFIRRANKGKFNPGFDSVNNPEEFLTEYIKNTKLINDRSLNIQGMLDVEGNFFRGKPVWDLLAFLKEVYDKDDQRYFYSSVRVAKPDAFPIQVLMIQALNLQGKEDLNGIIRYSNTLNNIIIDVVTDFSPPYYVNKGIDLQKATKFEPADPEKVKRINLNHYNIASSTVKRFEEIKWPKDKKKL